MSDVFEYKGYLGSAEVDIEGQTLVGRLLYIRDSIAYSADTLKKLERAFRDAVDDYLKLCVEQGDEPDQPLKGSFNVRVGSELHRKIAIAARQCGKGLNEFVCAALERAVGGNAHVSTRAWSVEPAHIFSGMPVYVVGHNALTTAQPQTLVVSSGDQPDWEFRGTGCH